WILGKGKIRGQTVTEFFDLGPKALRWIGFHWDGGWRERTRIKRPRFNFSSGVIQILLRRNRSEVNGALSLVRVKVRSRNCDERTCFFFGFPGGFKIKLTGRLFLVGAGNDNLKLRKFCRENFRALRAGLGQQYFQLFKIRMLTFEIVELFPQRFSRILDADFACQTVYNVLPAEIQDTYLRAQIRFDHAK